MNYLKKALMITELYEKVQKWTHTAKDVTDVLNAWQQDNEKIIEKGYYEKYWEHPTQQALEKFALEYFSENILSNPQVIQNMYEDLESVKNLSIDEAKMEAGARRFNL